MISLSPARIRIESISPYRLSLLVLAVSLAALFPLWIHYDIIGQDGAFQYIPIAEMFLRGEYVKGFSQPQPLFPLFIAGVSWISGFDLELSGRLVSACAFLLASLGMFKVSEHIFQDKLIALIAVLLFITNRELIVDSVECLKESLLILCIVWGNFFILKGISLHGQYKKAYFCLGGFLFLAGMLMRSTALLFLWAWIFIWILKETRNRAIWISLIIAPALVFILAWFINPDLPVFKKSYDLGLLFHNSHSFSGIIQASGKIAVDFFTTGNPIVILAAFIGLYQWKKDLYYFHVLIVLVFLFIILVVWGTTSRRYLLAHIVWVYPLASYAVVNSLSRTGYRLRKTGALLVVVSAILFWADKAAAPPDPDRLARKEAGSYIVERLGPGREVVTNRNRLAFYAKAKYVPLDTDIIDKLDSHCTIAADTMKSEGESVKKMLELQGRRPDRVFRTIYVYLPQS